MQYTFNRINVISHDIKIAPFHKLNQLFESHPLPNSLRGLINHNKMWPSDYFNIICTNTTNPLQSTGSDNQDIGIFIFDFHFRKNGRNTQSVPTFLLVTCGISIRWVPWTKWYHSRRFGGGGGCMGGNRSPWTTTVYSHANCNTITIIIINFIINSPCKPFSPHGPPCHCHRKNLNQNFMRAFIHPYHRSLPISGLHYWYSFVT